MDWKSHRLGTVDGTILTYNRLCMHAFITGLHGIMYKRYIFYCLGYVIFWHFHEFFFVLILFFYRLSCTYFSVFCIFFWTFDYSTKKETYFLSFENMTVSTSFASRNSRSIFLWIFFLSWIFVSLLILLSFKIKIFYCLCSLRAERMCWM